jgi:hypothetical protein
LRLPVAILAGLLASSTVRAAVAATPNSIVAVLGPSVGYMLSQSDLCQWNLADRIRKTYQRDFAAIGMTAAQQTSAWEQAAETQKHMTEIPPDAKDRMKADTCSPAERTRVEGYLK